MLRYSKAHFPSYLFSPRFINEAHTLKKGYVCMQCDIAVLTSAIFGLWVLTNISYQG